MDALNLLRIQAHANALANTRLYTAMAGLGSGEFDAPRVGFFPSLQATLNHVLEVDGYYISVLHRDPGIDTWWDRFVPASTLAELAVRQRGSDQRLLAWFDGADADADADADMASQPVFMPRGGGRVQNDLACHLLQHLFMHQTHHRGQAHAMLSGTTVAPPQLDEFLMPSESHLRSAEMAALGWHELRVYGGAP